MSNTDQISLTSIISRSQAQVSAEVDGETMMMSVEQGKYYGLDEIGTRIWNLIENPQPVSSVLETLLKEFDIDEKTCKQDLLELLHELNEKDLVEMSDGKDQ